MLCAAKIPFVAVGLGFCIFYGCKAVEILVNDPDHVAQKSKLNSWKFHQFWLNFVGSLTGWAAAYYFIFYRVLGGFSFKIEDTVVVVAAVLGVTGLLPYTLSKLTSLK